jgi:DNA-binding SARP family transcriptional activator
VLGRLAVTTGVGKIPAFTGADTSPAVSVKLLNGFRVTRLGLPLVVPLCAQRLIAFLALAGHTMQRTYVASALWLDCDDARASGNLRSAIWRVRSVGDDLISAGADQIALGEDVGVDLRDSDELAQRLLGATQDGDLRDGIEADLSGDLLPDWYEEWVVFERERHRQLRLHALEVLCEMLTQRRFFARAVTAGVAAVYGEPLRESAHRVLIKAHLAEGNRGEAVRQFYEYRRILADELQIQPTPDMIALVADCGLV